MRLTVDGGVVDTVTVERLKPGASRLLVFRGPECDLTVSAAADPDGLIAESSEDDNTQALSCAQLPRR